MKNDADKNAVCVRLSHLHIAASCGVEVIPTKQVFIELFTTLR
jgi:hypothetical protein